MNPDLNTSNQLKYGNLWVEVFLPGCEIKEAKICGQATLFLFQRSIDKLKGIFIRGQETNQIELENGLKELIQTHGSISIILDNKQYSILAQNYMKVPEMVNQSLLGRSISMQKVLPTEPTEQFNIPYNPMQGPNILNPYTQIFNHMHHPVQINKNELEGVHRELRKNEWDLSHDSYGNSRFCEPSYYDPLREHPDFKGKDFMTIEQVMDSVLNGGGLEEFNKYFPSTNYHRDLYRVDVSYKWGDNPAKAYYYVHRETGVVICDSHYTNNTGTHRYRWQGSGFIYCNLGDYRKQVEQIDQTRGKAGSLQASIEEQIKNIPGYKEQEIIKQHAPWSQTLDHLGNIAYHFGSESTLTLLKQANLAQNLAMNFRLFSVAFSKMAAIGREYGLYEALVSSAGLAAIHPLVAMASLGVSIYAIAVTAREKTLTPLSQKLFVDAFDKCLLPLINNVHDSLAKGQIVLANHVSNQTQTILSALNLCQQDYICIIEANNKKIQKHLHSQDFNDFITGAQKRLEDYRDSLLRAKRLIKGRIGASPKDDLKWLPDYIDSTTAAIASGRKDLNNGLNGDTFKFSLQCAHQNPIFSSGILYHALFNDIKFPTELPILDSAAYTYIILIRSLFFKSSIRESIEFPRLNDIAKSLLNEVQKQLKLFDAIDAVFNNLVASHKNLVNYLKKGRTFSQTAKLQAIAQGKQQIKDNLQHILDAVVTTDEMYRFNKIVSAPLQLRSYQDEIFNLLTVQDSWSWIRTDPWHEAAKRVDTYVSATISLHHLRNSEYLYVHDSIPEINGYVAAKAHLSRRCWTVTDTNFNSSVIATTRSHLPFTRTLNIMYDNCVVQNPPVPPQNATVDFTLKYTIADRKLTTTFDNDSFLKMEDIQRIPRITNFLDSKNFVQNVVNCYLPDPENAMEICLPMHEDGSQAITLRKGTLNAIKNRHCLARLHNESTETRYSFKKNQAGDKYEFSIHNIFPDNVKMGTRLFELDSVTVENSIKQGQSVETIIKRQLYPQNTMDVCLPLRGGDLIMLSLPRTLLAAVKIQLCPEWERIESTGAIVDLRYSFTKNQVGDKYQFFIHSVYGENISALKADKKVCVFDVDAATVEFYSKSGKAPNLMQFLYAFIYLTDTDTPSIPNSATYIKKGDKAFTALGVTKFLGIAKILEQRPESRFSFDHQRYNEDAYNSINDHLKNGTNNAVSSQFFFQRDIEIDTENFIYVQRAIREKIKSAEKSREYADFEQKYNVFMALAKLVSAQDADTIRAELINSAGMIPPGEMGWFELSYYYTAPEQAEMDAYIQRLKSKPSLARQRLDLYNQNLPKISDAINKAINNNTLTKTQQIELIKEIPYLNYKKSRAHLEEDSKPLNGLLLKKKFEETTQPTTNPTKVNNVSPNDFEDILPSFSPPVEAKHKNAFNQRENNDYWYQSEDIVTILDAETLQDEFKEFHYIKPIKFENAERVIEDALFKLEDNKPLLCVYNISDTHWVAFSMFKKPDGSYVVLYKDSQGKSNTSLEGLLKKDGRDVRFIHNPLCEQTSGVACGIFAIQNLRIIAEGLKNNKEGFVESFATYNTFCSLETANEYRAIHFAIFYTEGVQAQNLRENNNAKRLKQVRETHFEKGKEVVATFEKIKAHSKDEKLKTVNFKAIGSDEIFLNNDEKYRNTIAVEIGADLDTPIYKFRILTSKDLSIDVTKLLLKECFNIEEGKGYDIEDNVIITSQESINAEKLKKIGEVHFDQIKELIERFEKTKNEEKWKSINFKTIGPNEIFLRNAEENRNTIVAGIGIDLASLVSETHYSYHFRVLTSDDLPIDVAKDLLREIFKAEEEKRYFIDNNEIIIPKFKLANKK